MRSVLDILAYPFAYNALIVGAMVSICAAILGSILVLKQYSMIGHALSDVGFAALSFSNALGLPQMLVSIPVVITASFAIMSFRKKTSGDVIIGMIATASLSIGILITSISNGFNIDVSNYMFGSILLITKTDVVLSIVLSALVVLLFVVFYNRFFALIYDEDFAVACGIRIWKYQFLIAFLTAITIVIGMRMMGTLLMSSLIIFPAAICKKFVTSFRALIFFSALISFICFLIGLTLSFLFDLPSGAIIVFINAMVFVLTRIYLKILANRP